MSQEINAGRPCAGDSAECHAHHVANQWTTLSWRRFWVCVLLTFIGVSFSTVAEAARKFPRDSQKPTVSITSPSAGSTVGGVVSVAVSASDNVGVVRVDLLVNGAVVASMTSAPYTFAWDTTKTPNGAATLAASAYDKGGNSGTAAETVTVSNTTADTTPPTVSITAPSAGSTVKGTVTVSINASDNVGVTKVNLIVGGTLVATDTTAPYSFSWDSTKVANGTVTVSAVAYDAAGHSATASETVTVGNDTTAPTVSISAPTAGSTVGGTVTVSANASDNVGISKVDLLANGSLVGSKASAPYSFSWDSTKVANGGATLTAKAYDTAGNLSSATSNVTVANVTAGGIYYVSSSSGSDSNPGTQAAPWKTLAQVAAARSVLKAGDSVLLKRGDIWYEQLTITFLGGASGTPITYGAYGSGALPTIDAQHTRSFGIFVDNASHIVVRDMRAINATADGVRIVAGMGNVIDVLVQGVFSEQNTRHGFSLESNPGVTHVDDIEYRNDEANRNGAAGFFAFHVSDMPTGVHYYDSKAAYNGQLSASHGFSTFYANNIHYHRVEAAFTNINPATGLSNGYTSEGIGICFDDFTNNSSVEHSYTHGNARTGLALAHQGSNNIATYNVVAANGVYGLVVNGGGTTGSSNIKVYNNTIYGNNGYGIIAWQPINSLVIENNIIMNNAGYGIGFSATGITNYTVATNIIYGNTKGTTSYVPTVTGTKVVDPLMVAPASGNFSLQASSPAINAGIYLGVPYNLGLGAGTVWPYGVVLKDEAAAWDIGAFVY